MQVSQADSDSSDRVGVKEDSIHFRPSPNFKKMKKFFKLKLDNEGNEIKNITNVAPDPPPPPNTEKSESKQEVQPPLPLDPPPDDKIVPEEADSHGDAKNVKPGITPYGAETEPKKKYTVKKTVCRDFIRGTCNRIGCRYAHKTDVSQEDLYGVYTFCRNYQSRVCAHTNCRYVHATVFEEQEYYRTRYLPPHVFAHIDNANNNTMNAKLAKLLMPPPPPPPPPHTSRKTDKKTPVNFTIPPPPIPNELEKQGHLKISSVPTDTMKSMPAPMPPIVPTSLERDWNIVEPFSNNSSCKPDAIDPVPKKCKQCDTIEFRRIRRYCHHRRK